MFVWTGVACGPDDTAFDTDPDPRFDDTCSEQQPDGPCPGARICVEGACVFDVDPGTPAPPLAQRLDTWERVAGLVADNYAAFGAKPELDWAIVTDDVATALASVETELGYAVTMSRGVAEIGDGHTYLVHPACQRLVLPARGSTNTGVCFVEGEAGAILANRVTNAATMDIGLGDRLLAVDGRPVERLLTDFAAQPRCLYVGSTPEMTRADRVQTLGWRAADESMMTVERPDGRIAEVPVELAGPPTRCDTRTPPPVQRLPGGLEWARLDGDVGYVWFPFFGSFNEEGRLVEQPLQGELRRVLSENRDIEALVIDLRANGGGYPAIYFDLASWLFQEPTRLFEGGFSRGGLQPVEVSPDRDLQLDVPVAVLVDARSFSAADFTAQWLIQTGRARSFGQPSGGGFGSSGIYTQADVIVAVNDYLAVGLDGAFLEGNPPPVDVVVWPRASDLAAGRDTVLEAALDWLRDEG